MFCTINQIYTSLTGAQHKFKIIGECPENYLNGLELSLKDEQNTVDFYLVISDDITDPYSKNMFRRIAANEQNYAMVSVLLW